MKELVEFCKREDLVITNTMLKRNVKNPYTWKSPGDLHCNLIHYVVINQKIKNYVKNIRTYTLARI